MARFLFKAWHSSAQYARQICSTLLVSSWLNCTLTAWKLQKKITFVSCNYIIQNLQSQQKLKLIWPNETPAKLQIDHYHQSRMHNLAYASKQYISVELESMATVQRTLPLRCDSNLQSKNIKPKYGKFYSFFYICHLRSHFSGFTSPKMHSWPQRTDNKAVDICNLMYSTAKCIFALSNQLHTSSRLINA